MFRLEDFHTQNIAVLGLARSGLASARCVELSGGRALCWDDSPEARQVAHNKGFSIVNLQEADWAQIHTLVLTPGIPHTYPSPHPMVAQAKRHHLTPICDIDLFMRTVPRAPVVGVTGTNGKSTTCTLISHLARNRGQKVGLGGNIGHPVLDLDPYQDLFVLELSSYHLDLTPHLNLDVSVLLNLSPDHLERHGGFQGYKAAKRRIFANVSKGVKGVINADQPACLALLKDLQTLSRQTTLPAQIMPISTLGVLPHGVCVSGGILTETHEGSCVFTTHLPAVRSLKGSHNDQNIAASYAALRLLGMKPDEIVSGLSTFQGLAHRQEWLGTFNGISYINDSKATNTESVATALAAYGGGPVYCILGGRPKEGGLEGLKKTVGHITHAFLIGEATQDFALFCALYGVPYTQSHTLHQALDQATQKALLDGAVSQGSPDPVVLLSPGCASFDQFENFEERGRAMAAWLSQKYGSPPSSQGLA